MKSNLINYKSLATFALSTALLTGEMPFHQNKIRNKVTDKVTSILDSSSDEEMSFPGEFLSFDLSGLSGTPLGMSGFRKNNEYFFGVNQANYITMFDSIAGGFGDAREEVVNVPYIFPELVRFFPKSIDSYFQKYNVSEAKEEKTCIFVHPIDNEYTALAFYDNGNLRVATYVSLGRRPEWTPRGTFHIGYKNSYARSSKYDNAPMPYALHVNGPIFIHGGEVTGKGKSHGCIRVPGAYAKILSSVVKTGTKVVIEPKIS